jgi:hypothetical protein
MLYLHATWHDVSHRLWQKMLETLITYESPKFLVAYLDPLRKN